LKFFFLIEIFFNERFYEGCRALGLPCRSVTSYRSPAQKTSLNVDIYWTEENERESDLYQAYQCWNDVWMRRDDIVGQSSYLGWQAIDPSYQGLQKLKKKNLYF
jgi:hypothetical protein